MASLNVCKAEIVNGIAKTVRWYLDNQYWMDNVTSGDYMKYYEDMYANR